MHLVGKRMLSAQKDASRHPQQRPSTKCIDSAWVSLGNCWSTNHSCLHGGYAASTTLHVEHAHVGSLQVLERTVCRANGSCHQEGRRRNGEPSESGRLPSQPSGEHASLSCNFALQPCKCMQDWLESLLWTTNSFCPRAMRTSSGRHLPRQPPWAFATPQARTTVPHVHFRNGRAGP